MKTQVTYEVQISLNGMTSTVYVYATKDSVNGVVQDAFRGYDIVRILQV